MPYNDRVLLCVTDAPTAIHAISLAKVLIWQGRTPVFLATSGKDLPKVLDEFIRAKGLESCLWVEVRDLKPEPLARPTPPTEPQAENAVDPAKGPSRYTAIKKMNLRSRLLVHYLGHADFVKKLKFGSIIERIIYYSLQYSYRFARAIFQLMQQGKHLRRKIHRYLRVWLVTKLKPWRARVTRLKTISNGIIDLSHLLNQQRGLSQIGTYLRAWKLVRYATAVKKSKSEILSFGFSNPDLDSRGFILSCIRQASTWILRYDHLSSLIKQSRTSAAIILRDAFGATEHTLALAIQEQEIPLFVMPISYNPSSQLAGVYRQRKAHVPPRRQGLRLQRLIPGQLMECHGDLVLRTPHQAFGGLYLAGVRSVNSWRIGETATGGIFVANHHTYELMKTDGHQKQKLHLIGHPNHDHLYRLYNDQKAMGELRQELGINSDLPVVVVSVAFDIYSSNLYQNNSFICNFDQYINSLKRSLHLIKGKANIVLSPHPRLRNDEFKMNQIRDLGEVTLHPINVILGLADGFISYVGSIVNYDATDLSVPTILVRLYRDEKYHISNKGKLSGSVLAESQPDFERYVLALLDPKSFSTYTEPTTQKSINIDGKFGERLVNLLDST